MIRYYNGENFEEVISGKVVVDFFATWCGPCRMLGQVLEQVQDEIGVDIVKVDIDKYPNLARKYGVMSVPTIMVFENGRELKKQIGFLGPDDLKKFVE